MLFGSANRKRIVFQIDASWKFLPLEMVKAGLHWSRKMSRHMLPFELIFGW